MAIAQADPEVYGGLRFSLYQTTDTGSLRFRVGPAFSFSRDEVSAGSSLEFEIGDEGELRQIVVSPELAYHVRTTPVRFAPGFQIERPSAGGTVGLLRKDGLLPRVGDFGAIELESLLRRVRSSGRDPDREALLGLYAFWQSIRKSLEPSDLLRVEEGSQTLPKIALPAVSDRSAPPVRTPFPAVNLGVDLELKLDPAFASSRSPTGLPAR